MNEATGNYAEVNGLKMYYEIRGAGQPLVLLHGSFGTAESWAGLLPALSVGRQVIVVEMQGHGHTADRDLPLSQQQMAEDVVALLQHLKITTPDIFGYSMGGGVALAVAMRHPECVRNVAVLGAGIGPMKETHDAESYRQFSGITPENFNFPQVKDPYVRVAPDPTKWPVLVAKLIAMIQDFQGYTEQDVRAIQARTLIMLGDRDGLRPEHAVEMYRLIPNAQLAIFPDSDHFVPFVSPDRVLSVLLPFLDAAERR